LATKRVACPECSATVPYGRLSCSTCGTLLASVAGSPRRVSLQPIVRRSRTSSVHAVAGNGRVEPTHANGHDEDDRPETSWREEELPGHAPGLQGHRQPLDFASVLAARSAATDGALALAIDRPANGTAPAPSMPSRLRAWDRPMPSAAAWESMTTRASHTVRDFVTSAAGVVATLRRPTVDTPALEVPRQIPGAYLAPSATRLVELRPEALPARTRRAASARAVPGLNHWYSVPDAPSDAPAGIMPAVVSLMPAGHAAVARDVRTQGTPPARTQGEIAAPSELPFATPNGPNGWATAVGGGLAALSVVLPWAKNGVAGGQLGTGYLAQWGLANPAYLLLLAAGLAMLLVTILPNRLPQAIREVALPLLFGGFLLGLAWTYATGPFGTGTGVGTMVVGAALLVTGGALGLRRFRPSLKTDDTPA
jgi:hypothetical protein